MDTWEMRLKPPNVPVAKYTYRSNMRRFHLIVESIKHNILKNITIDAMGYGQ